MNLPEILQSTVPFRPWIFTLACCLFSCISERTRRAGGILFVCVALFLALYIGMNGVLKQSISIARI